MLFLEKARLWSEIQQVTLKEGFVTSHDGFTDEELDFIINYDIKYRMGRESED